MFGGGASQERKRSVEKNWPCHQAACHQSLFDLHPQ